MTAFFTAMALFLTNVLFTQKGFSEIAEATSSSITVNNPIIWSDVPDEDVIRVGDTYYMVSTTMFFTPGAPIMKSKDLVSWEICSYVYDTLADGNKQNLLNGEHDYSHGSWAASLRYNKGTYYVFFASYGTGKSYIYKTNDIENGAWARSEISGVYHDASMLFDDDGKNYLVYGAGGTIKIKELNSGMTGFATGASERTLFSTGLDGLSGEGAHIQKINGYYYIFLIAWPSGSGRIELCYRSKTLLGSYEGKTILNSGIGTYSAGVAQGGIVDTPDGKWYGLLFQDHGSVGRIPVLVPVTWENDWPMMGVNGKAPLTITTGGNYTGTLLARSDDFNYSNNKLALEWQWNHNPDNTAWSVTERSGYLRLKNNTLATNLLNARNTLTQRTEGPSCSSIIKMDTSSMKVGDYAGLSAFQFKYGNVGVYVADDGTKKVYMATNGGYSDSAAVTASYNKIVAESSLSGNTVYLKINFNFNTVDSSGNSSYNIDKANFYYSYDGNSWTKIGEELGMTYSLKLFTGYRSAIYSYATKTTGGYVDVDYFDYERADWNQPKVILPDANGYYFHDEFETANYDWTARGGTTLELSGITPYIGTSALLVSNRTASWNGAQKALSTSVFKPGNSYSFSACVTYLEGNNTEIFHLTLQYTDANGETKYQKIDTKTVVKGEYIQLFNRNYKIPDDASNLYFYVETESDTVSFYLDEAIGAVAGTVINGPTEISFRLGDLNSDGTINAADLSIGKRHLLGGSIGSVAELAADVDQSGTVDMADIRLLEEFVLETISEFPIATGNQISPTEYMAAVRDALVEKEPASALQEASGVSYGTMQKVTYYSQTCKRNRKANVLLPANYSTSKSYPVLYVLHGYWGNEDSLLDAGDASLKLRQIIGNAIAHGEAKEMIVVFPYICQ